MTHSPPDWTRTLPNKALEYIEAFAEYDVFDTDPRVLLTRAQAESADLHGTMTATSFTMALL